MTDARRDTAEGLAGMGCANRLETLVALAARYAQGGQDVIQQASPLSSTAALSGGRECLYTWRRLMHNTVEDWACD